MAYDTTVPRACLRVWGACQEAAASTPGVDVELYKRPHHGTVRKTWVGEIRNSRCRG